MTVMLIIYADRKMCVWRGEITDVYHIVMDNNSKSDAVGRNRGGGGDNIEEGKKGGREREREREV